MTQGAEGATQPKDGIFRDWVLPILVGLVLGAGLVWAWRALRSPAEKLVAGWTLEDFETNNRLADSIRGLGKEARGDLLAAFRAIDVSGDPAVLDDKKLWAAKLLAEAPFFDTRSLLDLVRDPGAPLWDRRVAAAALVEMLRRDVDVQAVVPVLFDWLTDVKLLEHSIPLMSLKILHHEEALPPDRDTEWVRALVLLAEGKSRPEPEDELEAHLVASDRNAAIRELGSESGDADVAALLWRVASDEADRPEARNEAIRTLAENAKANGAFSQVERWEALTKSPARLVRQSAADNLFHTQDPRYDPALAALHTDADVEVRAGSVSTQVQRKRPTMLPLMDQLLEDHSEFLRGEALVACGVFRDEVDGLGARQGMILRILERSDSSADVEGAVLALHLMTGEHFGFAAGDVDARGPSVNPDAVAVFLADPEARKLAVEKWRARLGKDAVWTDEQRRAALEKLRSHADPENAARAARELQ